ncbi:hypothetical protein YOLOSWAG_24 [Erwinia phage vB_EamM_Yoloswag]|uniref:Uncharacterized protein n=1 Tax=Erwinia phage vB_EamM_Yoloswag TaxID=1958956 RepID=A0A1S6L2V4_9CAUD|nr:hypothetical protein HOR66_gp024 [Erwinia phage vB_EamM_Yoloswag]AQT28511.1 hypothetical protein YOLOSWAG_24 [Erwinia phage vB_EamM_Yoloswag]
MSPFSILQRQVVRALTGEANLEPEERALFDWRFVVDVGGKFYTVGKTGANTVYYMTPEMTEPVPCYPDQIAEIITGWAKPKYISYMICHKRFDNVKLDNIKTEQEALRKVPKTFHDKTFIVGITSKGKRHKLYRLQAGLNGNAWVPVSEESE